MTDTKELQDIGKIAYESVAELVAALEEAGDDDDKAIEEAEQRIQEDPLSIEVRSGWAVLGQPLVAEEYNILLATGGPAYRIVGDLGLYTEPETARLEVQDWGTPWTEYRGANEDVLLTYARQFYFGV